MKSNSLSWYNKKDRALVADVLRTGGVALGPSDTVIGLLSDATARGIEQLNVIKGRAEKPYIILVGSLEKVSHYAQLPVSFQVEKIMRFCWPGPVTLILKSSSASPVYPNKTVAVRVPAHEGLLELLMRFDGLLSTSANKAGCSVPATMEDVDAGLRDSVDCVIDDPTHTAVPSTILDCTGDQIVVVREGAYKKEDLERIAGVSFTKS